MIGHVPHDPATCPMIVHAHADRRRGADVVKDSMVEFLAAEVGGSWVHLLAEQRLGVRSEPMHPQGLDHRRDLFPGADAARLVVLVLERERLGEPQCVELVAR
ncbi:MAG TPA: hypothetical protein VLM79_04730 [Kofleriaceae bacterium]|nr:hypothetical protein [Kofleriaceae bacterium]